MITVSQDIDNFLSTNATDTVALYSPDTIYEHGAEVRVDSRIYKSLIASNQGNYPPNTKNKFWYDDRYSNEFAMLDLNNDTQTEFTANGVVVFEKGLKQILAIANFRATQITEEYLDDLDNVLKTDIYNFSGLGNRINKYDYIYANFVSTQTATLYRPIARVGTKIRITFTRGGESTSCGIFVAGNATKLGTTADRISFVNKKIGFDIKKVASFQTSIEKTLFNEILEFGNINLDVPMLFIIDPSVNSSHQNLVIIAKITNASGVAESQELNMLSWELTQN